MDRDKRDELDTLLEMALQQCLSNEAPPERVWANIRRRVHRLRRQPQSRLEYLSHVGSQAMSWMSDVGSTAQIMLASLYVRSNGEEWTTERLIVARRSAGPTHYTVHY